LQFGKLRPDQASFIDGAELLEGVKALTPADALEAVTLLG